MGRPSGMLVLSTMLPIVLAGPARMLSSGVALVRQSRRPYFALNLIYYGLVVGGMTFVVFRPSVQHFLLQAVGGAFMEGPLSVVGSAYVGGQVLVAIMLTFIVNLVVGSILCITIPSLLIPFSGIVIGGLRAVLWGLLLSPAMPELRMAMVPHSVTLVLEGQAYTLAMLGAYIHGRAFLWPDTVGVAGRRQAYLGGVRRTLRLYVLVAIMLAVAAVYEAIEVIFVIPLL